MNAQDFKAKTIELLTVLKADDLKAAESLKNQLRGDLQLLNKAAQQAIDTEGEKMSWCEKRKAKKAAKRGEITIPTGKSKDELTAAMELRAEIVAEIDKIEMTRSPQAVRLQRQSAQLERYLRFLNGEPSDAIETKEEDVPKMKNHGKVNLGGTPE